MTSVSKENYLKLIYAHKQRSNESVTTSILAQDLEVSNAATSEMAKKLYSSGLVTYRKYKGLELTQKGTKIALDVVRRHRLWELFLMKVLGLSWAEVHDEAERLEHISSEKLIDKIDEYLEYPILDPHGEPIPNKDGVMPEVPKSIKLSEGKIGTRYELTKVDDRGSDLVMYLNQVGMGLNKRIYIVEKYSFDNSVVIKFDGKELSLSEKVAQHLFIIKTN
ncbi:iron-dependent repressor IdeR [bacterium BMS3Abin04]|nr:iron-dependent repressor IdeR [bacterium BMS3Abin04]